MVRKTKEDAEITRARLLDAAQELFISKGVSSTTLNDIAKEAGLTRGAVYWHFENKDAIIIALWERGAGPLSHEMAAALSDISGPNAAEDFRITLLQVLGRIVSDPSVGPAMRVIIHCVEITDTQTPLRDFLVSHRNHIYTTIYTAIAAVKESGGLKSEASIDVLAGGLTSYLYGLIANHLESDSFLNLSRDYEALLDIYLKQILKSD